jgi:hypothetical protein
LFSVNLLISLLLLQVKELGRLNSTVDVKPMGTVAADEKAVLIPSHSDDDCFGSKYQVHLNVSSFNGCFFYFGSRSGCGSCFPIPKD